MGRKNSRAQKTRLNRREKGAPRSTPKRRDIPPVEVEDLVLPDGICHFQSGRKGKARFGTEAKAAKALRQAQNLRRRSGSTHVEKRYYPCPEGGCGGFHLTSREQFDEDLWKKRKDLYQKRQENAS